MDQQLTTMEVEDRGSDFELADILAIVKRRKWHILVPAVGFSVITIAVTVLWPPVYRSEATILIEQPDVPPDLVSSTVTSYADQRIAVIKQRAMTTDNVVALINKFDLYPEDRKRLPMTAVVDKVRSDVKVEMKSADVTDPSSGRPKKASIAFGVAAEYGDPRTAQKVANELVSVYLSENVRTRQRQAEETSKFLDAQADALKRHIDELEKKLSDLKIEHDGSLPEQRAYNTDALRRAEDELKQLDARASVMAELRANAETELASLTPYGPYVLEGEQVLSPQDKLKALRVQLLTLSARYTEKHPDILTLRQEVAALEAQLAKGGAGSGGATDQRRGGFAPDNPRFIQLQGQLTALDLEAHALARRRAAVESEIAQINQRLAKTPVVEEEYRTLVRTLEFAQGDLAQLRQKRLSAELGESLEAERKSERFTLIDPPQVPPEPVRPKRLLVLGVGLFLSVGGGAGIALLAELLDPAVRGSKKLAALVGAPPLVIVPYIRTRGEIVRRWWRFGIVTAAFVAVAAAAVAYVHWRVTPLDVLAAKWERRLDAAIGQILK
jgi:polysaccharide chain length determinant protein (PEP-CTERM system associated)